MGAKAPQPIPENLQSLPENRPVSPPPPRKHGELTSGEHRELMRLRLRVQAADCLAATVDCMVYRKVIDARSPIADARLGYGEPFGVDEAEALMRRTRPACER